jgi:MOSC domain-containing protein YiiM
MKKLGAFVVSVHSGDHEDLHKDELEGVEVDAEGFPGDKHRGFTRVAWQGDKDPEGTVRRNERQWSGVSAEELEIISRRMDLGSPLEASTLGANLCVEGIPGFSQLQGGTRLVFPSGAVLVIEEENPPCAEMGVEISAAYTTSSGEPAVGKMFGKHSIGLQGVVGVVDVPGEIRAGDRIVLEAPNT